MVIEKVLRGIPGCHLDDIFVMSNDIDELSELLRRVFQRIANVNLELNPKKCRFFQTTCEYLGHRISSEGILPDLKKLKAVQLYPRPTSQKAVRQFYGLASFFRR